MQRGMTPAIGLRPEQECATPSACRQRRCTTLDRAGRRPLAPCSPGRAACSVPGRAGPLAPCRAHRGAVPLIPESAPCIKYRSGPLAPCRWLSDGGSAPGFRAGGSAPGFRSDDRSPRSPTDGGRSWRARNDADSRPIRAEVGLLGPSSVVLTLPGCDPTEEGSIQGWTGSWTGPAPSVGLPHDPWPLMRHPAGRLMRHPAGRLMRRVDSGRGHPTRRGSGGRARAAGGRLGAGGNGREVHGGC
jgi:hypothetical protein